MDCIGIDVGAKELFLVIRKNHKNLKAQIFPNTPKGHLAIVKKLSKLKQPKVVLEATGTYHIDLAYHLDRSGIDVMVINPKASFHFGKSLSKRNKTDAGDAQILAQLCDERAFKKWNAPNEEVYSLRAISRHITTLQKKKTRIRNQYHSSLNTQTTPKFLLKSMEREIAYFAKEIKKMTARALQFILENEVLNRYFVLLQTVKGIAEKTALRLLPELLILPKDMTNRQWVAHAGLDPRVFQSGTSVEKKPRISKSGNKHIRSALFFPSMVGVSTHANIGGFFQHLVEDNGLEKMQAYCAVQRKLLHAIHGMFKSGQPFDGTRFYKLKT